MAIDDSTLTLRAEGTGRPVTSVEVFDAFVLARSRGLLRTAYLLTQDHALAEDLVQTALAKAWFAWSRIEGGDPEPYVRKVMVNTYSSWWRRRWNGEHPTDELPETAAPASAEERTDVWRALQRLPRRQRAVVVLRFYEDLSEAETARILGCSAGTVKSQTSKAFAKLRLDPALTNRATEPDERSAGLLPGVHRKITQTKRRRVAIVGAAIVAIVALVVAPTLTDASAPEPAQPPADYTKDGITLPGQTDDNTLDKGWIGKPGESAINFTWTPTVQTIALYPYCRSGQASAHTLVVRFNGHKAATAPCLDGGDAPDHWIPVEADNSVWLDAPIGKPVQVTAWLTDENGRQVRDKSAQFAVGLYTTPSRTAPGVPIRDPSAGPGDFAKDGIRYRAKVGGDTLAAAAVGDPGQSDLKLRFTASGAPVSLRSFCTANSLGAGDSEYQLAIQLADGAERRSSCVEGSTDAGAGSSVTLPDMAKAGETVDVTVRLLDSQDKPVSLPKARIGLGIYQKGAQRTIEDATLDELIEYDGYNYKLAEVETADATKAKSLQIATPADKPFLIAYGSSDLGPHPASISLDGISAEGVGNSSDSGSAVLGLYGEKARPTADATLKLDSGAPTKGKLILAIYIPAE